jgi:hypothetical protein
MKRVADMASIDNPGDFFWRTVNDQKYIVVALPRPRDDAPNDWIMNMLPVEPGTANRGISWGFDGNENAPTLTPSVHCIGHWHGWVRAGTLVEA